MPQKCLISYKNTWIKAWNAVPMFLSVYNAFMIPIDISIGLPFEFLQINVYIDIVLDVMFLIDNVLVFFTSFQNRKGQEVTDFYMIYLNYTRTWRFLFDTLSLCGIYFFTQINNSFKYF